jgi:hypothetical protein
MPWSIGVLFLDIQELKKNFVSNGIILKNSSSDEVDEGRCGKTR